MKPHTHAGGSRLNFLILLNKREVKINTTRDSGAGA